MISHRMIAFCVLLGAPLLAWAQAAPTVAVPIPSLGWPALVMLVSVFVLLASAYLRFDPDDHGKRGWTDWFRRWGSRH